MTYVSVFPVFVLFVNGLGSGLHLPQIQPVLDYLGILQFTFITSYPGNHRDLFRQKFFKVDGGNSSYLFGNLIIDWNAMDHIQTKVSNCDRHVILILHSNVSNLASLGLQSHVNQRIFFFNKTDLTLKERYILNEHVVENDIGYVIQRSVGTFVFVSFSPDGFLDRRSNLRQAHFRVLVEFQRPSLYLKANSQLRPEEIILTPSGDQVYSVRENQVQGLYHDVLGLLMRNMNFTVSRFKRADGHWGNMMKNQSWTGIISSLKKNEFDFAATSVTLLASRSQAVDFLFPLGTETFALFLKRSFITQEYHWSLFLEPFSKYLWLFLIVNALVCVVILRILDMTHQSCLGSKASFYLAMLSDSWMVVGSYFAMRPSLAEGRALQVYSKVFIFSIFLIGNVVFMTYRASLTSELSVRKDRIPFSTPGELLELDFNLVVRGKSVGEYHFTHARPGSIFKQLFLKFQGEDWNRNEMFLDTEEEAIEKALTEPATVLYSFMEEILDRGNLICDFTVPWDSHYPEMNSMAFAKSSQYKELFQYQIFRLIESGSLDSLRRKWKVEHFCHHDEDLRLGFEKLCSLFAFLLGSFCLTGIIFVVEHAVSVSEILA